jgi:hypothetical protein
MLDAGRIMAKVDMQPGPFDTLCWHWTGSITASGYGQVWFGAHGRAFAHRASYETFIGPIPTGLQIDHLCRVRHCVNPDHLEPVTQRVNILRGVSFAADQARRTHCPAGHAYDGDNLVTSTDRGKHCRYCRTCKNATARGWRSRRKAQAPAPTPD